MKHLPPLNVPCWVQGKYVGYDTDDAGLEGLGGGHQTARRGSGSVRSTAETSELSGLADADNFIAELLGEDTRREGSDEREIAIRCGDLIGLADTSGGRVQEARRGQIGRIGESGISQELEYSGPTNGFWRSADWLLCRDGKFRPVEPIVIKVAHGTACGMVSTRPATNTTKD